MEEGSKKKELFDSVTLGVVESLEKKPGVCDVKLLNRPPVERHMILSWELKHGCLMPEDLKHFFHTTDGLLLTWSAKLNDHRIPVGRMEINSVSNLVRLSGSTGASPSSVVLAEILYDSEDEEGDQKEGALMKPRFDNSCRIFEIDPCQGYGKVCLVYTDIKQGTPAQNPQVWFIDRALQFHFLADNFMGYYRLLLMHYGISQWQYAFTDIGLSPAAKQWFYIYAPSRLDMDTVQKSQQQPMLTGDQQVETPSVNTLDVNKVFKGKSDKKKPQQPAANQASKKRTGLGSASARGTAGGSRSASSSQPGRTR